MSYQFGVHRGHLKSVADTIAHRHGAWHINTSNAGNRLGWFECRDDSSRRTVEHDVLADVEEAGGFEKLRRKHRG